MSDEFQQLCKIEFANASGGELPVCGFHCIPIWPQVESRVVGLIVPSIGPTHFFFDRLEGGPDRRPEEAACDTTDEDRLEKSPSARRWHQ